MSVHTEDMGKSCEQRHNFKSYIYQPDHSKAIANNLEILKGNKEEQETEPLWSTEREAMH